MEAAEDTSSGVRVTVTLGAQADLVGRNQADGKQTLDGSEVPTEPPIVLTPLYGSTIFRNIFYEFTWSAVPFATTYDLWIPAADTTFSVSTTSLDLAFGGSGAVVLEWFVRGRSVDGDGPWSDTGIVNLVDQTAPPTMAPPLESPPQGWTINTDETVRFSWEPLEHISGYEIQIGNDPIVDRGRMLDYARVFSSPGSRAWRVRAYNTIAEGPWSETRTLFIESGGQIGDPGMPDTVRIGCPVLVDPVIVGDSFEVPINIWFDEYVYDMNLAFEYENTVIEPSSVSLLGSVIPLSQQDALFVGFNIQGHYFTISWTDPSLQLPLPPITSMQAQPLLSVYFKILEPASGQTRDIDTLVMSPTTGFSLAVDTTNTEPLPWTVMPVYTDCGQEDIVFSTQYAPYFVSPPTPDCGSTIEIMYGQQLSFEVVVRDSTVDDLVTLNVNDLPLGATMTPLLPTSGNPVSSIFSWTPGADQIGTHMLEFGAVDFRDGLSTVCSIWIEVTDPNPDPGIADTVRIGCPVLVDPVVVGDSFAVPIYAWWDDYVYGLIYSFTYDSDLIEATSVGAGLIGPPPLPNSGIDTVTNTVALHWSDMIGENPLPPTMGSQGVLLNTIYFRIVEAASNDTIGLTPNLPPLGNFSMTASADGEISDKVSFTPLTVACDGNEIILGDPAPRCGDVNGDGSVGITDQVYLIGYLFGGGPPPALGTGDVDECGSINIADVFYLTDFFFGSGPAPCEGDVDCLVLSNAAEVVVECPIEVRAGETDSFAIEIRMSTEVYVREFTTGLSYSSASIEYSSVDVAGSVLTDPEVRLKIYSDPSLNTILLRGTGLGGQEPIENGLICRLWFQLADEAPAHSIDIDSAFIPPGGEFVFVPLGPGVIKPRYSDCGTEDIIILPAIEPLTITGYAPLDSLMIDDTISVDFSHALNRSTVTPQTFQVLADDVPISGNRSFASDDFTLLFVPTTIFPPLATITLGIDGVEGTGGEVWAPDASQVPNWESGFGVHPGDLNNDGVVNDSDIDQIAVHWSLTGPARDNFADRWRLWQIQPAYGWIPEAATYADANGDGLVDETDLFPIGRHFGETHNFAIPVARLSDGELVLRYRPQVEALLNSISGNTEPFLVRAQQRLALLLGKEILPSEFAVSQNYPNPFNPYTSIRLSMPQAGRVIAELFNARGQRVRVLVDDVFTAGEHLLKWDGRDESGVDVASGVYFYRIEATGLSETRKMLLLR